MSCSFHLRPGTASWCLSIDMHQHILIWTKILLKPFSKSCQMFFRYLCITYLIAAKGELRWGVHTWAGGGAAGRAGVVRDDDGDLVAFLVCGENERLRWPS